TGMLPHRHGVRSAETRSLLGRPPPLDIVPPGIGFDALLSPVLEERGTVVSDRRTPAFWEIAGRDGARVEAAGWDLDLDAAPAPGVDRAGAAVRKDWIGKLLAPDVLRQRAPRAASLVRVIDQAAAADASVLGTLHAFEGRDGSGVAALCFPGLDRVAHVFL